MCSPSERAHTVFPSRVSPQSIMLLDVHLSKLDCGKTALEHATRGRGNGPSRPPVWGAGAMRRARLTTSRQVVTYPFVKFRHVVSAELKSRWVFVLSSDGSIMPVRVRSEGLMVAQKRSWCQLEQLTKTRQQSLHSQFDARLYQTSQLKCRVGG